MALGTPFGSQRGFGLLSGAEIIGASEPKGSYQIRYKSSAFGADNKEDRSKSKLHRRRRQDTSTFRSLALVLG
jgi:hypothetical protein